MIYRLKMKKLLPALALFILTACESSEDKDVHFETVTADKTVVLSNEEMSPQCSVHLKLEQAIIDNNRCGELINEAVIAKLLNIQGESNVKKAAERFADDYTEAYMRNLLPLYNEDRSDTTKRSWYEYHYIIEATAGKGTENTIVYDATIDDKSLQDAYKKGLTNVRITKDQGITLKIGLSAKADAVLNFENNNNN